MRDGWMGRKEAGDGSKTLLALRADSRLTPMNVSGLPGLGGEWRRTQRIRTAGALSFQVASQWRYSARPRPAGSSTALISGL
jgi:hypothetical protein